MIEVAVAGARRSSSHSSSGMAKGMGEVDMGGCGRVGIRCLCSCNPPRRPNIYLCARHVHAYAPPCTLPTYLPHSEGEMTWNDGYDEVFPECETKKEKGRLAPDYCYRCWWEKTTTHSY